MLVFEVEFCLQTSYKMADFHMYNEKRYIIVLSVTFVEIGFLEKRPQEFRSLN